MTFTLKPGARLFSATCCGELIVVKAPSSEIDLTIGGAPPLISAAERGEAPVPLADGHGGGTQLGKRYVDEANRIELLCVKPGKGLPALDGEVLRARDAKALPASD